MIFSFIVSSFFFTQATPVNINNKHNMGCTSCRCAFSLYYVIMIEWVERKEGCCDVVAYRYYYIIIIIMYASPMCVVCIYSLPAFFLGCHNVEGICDTERSSKIFNRVYFVDKWMHEKSYIYSHTLFTPI